MNEAKKQQLETALELMQRAKKIVFDVRREEESYFKDLPLYNTDEGRESLNSLSGMCAVNGFLKEAVEELYLTIDGIDDDLEWFTPEGLPNGDWPIDRADD